VFYERAVVVLVGCDGAIGVGRGGRNNRGLSGRHEECLPDQAGGRQTCG
jgi:hypothetical protein